MLQNGKIRLRALEPQDIDLLYNWENNQDNWMVSNTITPYSKFVLEQYLMHSHEDIFTTKQLRLIIEFEGCPIGAVDLFDFDPHHKRCGIGILIADKQHRGKGYGSLVIKLLIDYCFEILGLRQIYCNILASNKKSIQLFEKLGFEWVGLKKDWVFNQGLWHNECMYQCLAPINYANYSKG